MYKLKDEYKGQDVTIFLKGGGVIKLENADQDEFAKVYKVEGYQKFIDFAPKKESVKKEVKK